MCVCVCGDCSSMPSCLHRHMMLAPMQNTHTLMGDYSSNSSTPPFPINQQEPCLLTSYTGHKGGVTCIKFRPFMKHLVSGGVDGSVLLWSLFCRPNLARQTQIRPYRFLGHQGEVCAVAISPLDTVVASASKDKTVRLWIPTAEGKSSVIRAHSSTIRTVAFSPDGECLLTGSDDKALKIWDVESERFLAGLSGHMNWVRSAEFNSNGRLVVSGGDDKTVRLWDVERHECVHVFNDVPGMVNCTRFHPFGSCIGSSGADQAVQIWDIRSKMLIQHYAENARTVRSLCFHPHGNFLLSTCDDATLKIWDLREGQILYTIKGHEGATTCAEFSPSGDHFASGSQDEQVMLWQSNLKQPRKALKPGTALRRDFSCFAPNPDQAISQKNQSSPPQSSKKEGPNGVSTPLDTNLKPCQDPLESTTTKAKGGADNAQEQIVEEIKHTSKEESSEANGSSALPKAPSLESNKVTPLYLTSEETQTLGMTLEHLVSQLDTLTSTITIFGERLSHIEDKVLRLEKLGSASQLMPTEARETSSKILA